jgi:hypothetical protein
MGSSEEKRSVASSQSVAEKAQPVVDDAASHTFDENATKKLLRKLDWNVVPFLSLLYL